MTMQVTIGDAEPGSGGGTISARLTSRLFNGKKQPMIEVTAASGPDQCTVRLTVSEAEVLHTALDAMIFDAALSHDT